MQGSGAMIFHLVPARAEKGKKGTRGKGVRRDQGEGGCM